MIIVGAGNSYIPSYIPFGWTSNRTSVWTTRPWVAEGLKPKTVNRYTGLSICCGLGQPIYSNNESLMYAFFDASLYIAMWRCTHEQVEQSTGV
jgi:hypothetical protein